MSSTIIDSVTLNFTDLMGTKTGCTKLGSNKFWKGWVVDNGDGTFSFECLWGPTGKPGKDKGSKRNINEAAARKLLASKKRSKIKKGYTELEVRDDAEEASKQTAATTPATTTAPVTTSLHHEVERLLGVIYNETSRVVRAGLSSQAGSTADNPIGNLSDRQLDVGGEILDRIADLLSAEFGRESIRNRNTALPLAAGHIPRSDIMDLTNQYMSNVPREIPHQSRGRGNLHRIVVSSYERLEVERKFLQLLRDAHLSRDVFKAAAHQTAGNSKAQVWYDGLGCLIEYCVPSSPEFSRVREIFETGQSRRNANWFRGARSTLRVARVFKFTRNGTETRYEQYATKMRAKRGTVGEIMAWHGSRVANILGIGRSGLLMPENLPRGVHLTGKVFGRGIYHAPVFTDIPMIQGVQTDGTNGALKSANYMGMKGSYYGTGNTSRNGFMFLQDVALGRGDVHSSTCWDKHRPNNWPNNDFIYAASSKCTSLTHDEIVTFDEDAQVFRYLVELEVC